MPKGSYRYNKNMSWNVLFFETNRQEKPVEEFVESLSPAGFAKVLHALELLKQFGTFLCMPHCRKLTEEIYELRIRGKDEIRILYFIRKRSIYLLHAFKKQSQKTPTKEIKIAERRMRLLTYIT